MLPLPSLLYQTIKSKLSEPSGNAEAHLKGEGSNTSLWWLQMQAAEFCQAHLPLSAHTGFFAVGTDSCGHGWLEFPFRPDEQVPPLAAAWGCLHALNVKLERKR